MSVADSIGRFCSYFEREADAIERVRVKDAAATHTGVGNHVRYQKILYVAAIDTLAGTRFQTPAYPELAVRNRERFIRFLKDFASWPDGELVSTPFLQDRLIKAGLSQRPLASHVATRLARFSTEDGSTVPAREMDQPLAELLPFAQSQKEESLLREFQHFALFYRYRNSLVHDSREPGDAMETFDDEGAPYYHGYIGEAHWFLCYPLPLFKAILTQSVASLRDFLELHQLDPYARIADEPIW